VLGTGKMFVESPVSNLLYAKWFHHAADNRFLKPTLKCAPWVVIVKHDNQLPGIIDEYHAHKDDTVKENLESSTVQRTQALIYHITTAGANVQSACKR
jgi:hypothetical protein